jgi:pimeloyl-ACP methyl ester carboxylesterase
MEFQALPANWSRPEHRVFTSHDGTPIGYQVFGNPDGIPFLLANGLGGRHQAYRFIIERFAPAFRFFVWDYRGMYDSGRPVSGYRGLSLPHHAADGLALMDHEGVDEFLALGWSMGVQVLLEMQRVGADRFLGLILHNGVAGKPYETLVGAPVSSRVVPTLLRGLQRAQRLTHASVKTLTEWPMTVELFVRLGVTHHALDREVFSIMAKNFQDLDMHLYMEQLLLLGEHDAHDVLAEVLCPTLVVAGSSDLMTPLATAQRLAQGIPGAALEVIPGGSHYAAVEFPELLNQHLSAYLRSHFSDALLVRGLDGVLESTP